MGVEGGDRGAESDQMVAQLRMVFFLLPAILRWGVTLGKGVGGLLGFLYGTSVCISFRIRNSVFWNREGWGGCVDVCGGGNAVGGMGDGWGMDGKGSRWCWPRRAGWGSGRRVVLVVLVVMTMTMVVVVVVMGAVRCW